MPIAAPIHPTTPLTPEEGARVRELAAGLVAQAENLGVQMGRDPRIAAQAVLIRALADAVCNIATLEATADDLGAYSAATIQRLTTHIGKVQVERFQAAGIEPPIGEQVDIEAIASPFMGLEDAEAFGAGELMDPLAALKRARFWLDAICLQLEIDPEDTNVQATFMKRGGDGTSEKVAERTINLAQDLESFAALGAVSTLEEE